MVYLYLIINTILIIYLIFVTIKQFKFISNTNNDLQTRAYKIVTYPFFVFLIAIAIIVFSQLGINLIKERSTSMYFTILVVITEISLYIGMIHPWYNRITLDLTEFKSLPKRKHPLQLKPDYEALTESRTRSSLGIFGIVLGFSLFMFFYFIYNLLEGSLLRF